MSVETDVWCVAQAGAALELRKLTLSPLTASQVQVQVKYCGLCHTDIHMKNNDWGISNYPMVPGHEGIGVVSAVGSAVSNLKVGDTVGIGWIRGSCMNCKNCSVGKDNLCNSGYQGTYLSSNAGIWGRHDFAMQGCFARTMHIEERFAFKIPKGLNEAKAAPLMCAGVTVWEPIVNYVKPGSRVGVLSLGGLGHMAVKLANAAGGIVTVLSSSASKKDKALEIGASSYVNYNNADELKEAAGSLDVIIDTCPVSHDLAMFLDLLTLGGTFVRVGIPSSGTSGFKYDYIPLIFTQKSIAGSVVCGSANTRSMLEVSSSHHLESNVEVVSFSKINEVMDMLADRKNSEFRYVLKWD